MTVADKIIFLRKKNGWSQEELAERMDVSRQAVSKWESAHALPDVEKIVALSELFGVTTDYLLKEGIEAREPAADVPEDGMRRLCSEEAERYVGHRKWASVRIAAATLLCILSPITLLILGALSELTDTGISEMHAGAIGLSALFVTVAVAVGIFILCEMKGASFEFIEKGKPFVLDGEARGMIEDAREAFRSVYIRCNIIATSLCVLSPVPLLIGMFTENELLVAILLTVTIAVAGVGVFIFITVGVRFASFGKLLKDGEYSTGEKRKSGVKDAVGFIYWGAITAAYLVWSFLGDGWHITWLVFAVGGVLFPAVMTLCDLLTKKEE